MGPVHFGANTINFATTQPFPSPPSAKNWLGTDANGGDVFARILYGTRISILFGLMLTICSSVMGVLAGALQGYYGGKVDLWGQRLIEVWSGMPTLFLIILLSSVVQPNFWWLLAITVLFGWMSLVGVVRAEFYGPAILTISAPRRRLASAIVTLSCAICCLMRWSLP